MSGNSSESDECVPDRFSNVPNRDSATATAQRSAAQKGQYSAPMYVISGLPSAPFAVAPFPTLVGRTSPEGLPTASRVAVGTESAATTWGDSAVVPVLVGADEPPVPVPVPDPVAERCEDAAAGGLEFPAALITTMVAMAATTSPTGTSAVITGWRERNRVGGAWAWAGGPGPGTRMTPWIWGRGEWRMRSSWRFSCWHWWWAAADATAPMGTSTCLFSWIGRARRQGARARRLETEAAGRLPGLMQAARVPSTHETGRPGARRRAVRARRTEAGGTGGRARLRGG